MPYSYFLNTGEIENCILKEYVKIKMKLYEAFSTNNSGFELS